jgi:TRAP-type C4-dicarboxylate transport system permease small subunit
MTALDALTRVRRCLDRIGGAMNAAAGWLLSFCAVLISAEILGRQVGFSLGATLEISSYILAISISWGLARAMSERQHVRIDLLVARAPLRLRQVLHAAALLAMLAWSLLLAYAAVMLVLESHDFGATDRSTLAIPLVVPQGLWAAGIVLFVVFVTFMLAEVGLAIICGRPEHVESIMGPRTLQEEAREALEAVGAPTKPDL